MLVISKIKGLYLHLDAYSHSKFELDDIYRLLNDEQIQFSTELIPNDDLGRKGIKFKIHDSNVHKLELLLGITFIPEDDGVSLKFEDSSGISYKCERLNENECETFIAISDGVARIKCGAIAKENGWIGGVSTPGSCYE